MVLFWSIAVAMLAASIAFLTRPLLWPRRQPEGERPGVTQLNAEVYEDQLAELERDLAAGLLDAEQFAAAREDLQRSLVESSVAREEVTAVRPAGRTGARGVALLVAVFVPAVAIPTYLWLGAGEAGINPRAAIQVPTDNRAGGGLAQMEEMVAALEARLRETPDDAEGWRLLGRSYYAMERYAKASEAYEQAAATGGEHPDLLASWADALAGAEGGFAGRPAELIGRALEMDPEHSRSLWLAGVAAWQVEEFEETRTYWNRLLDLIPRDAPEREVLESYLEDLENEDLEDGATSVD